METPYLGIRPKYAELWATNQQRVVKVCLPPKTRPEMAERACRKAVLTWLEGLDGQGLKLVSPRIAQIGPRPCPFLENFGDDMYLFVGRFRATKPRLVAEDVVVANRRLAEEAGVDYEDWRSRPEKALPSDFMSQLDFVEENQGKVYQDLRELERMKGEGHGGT